MESMKISNWRPCPENMKHDFSTAARPGDKTQSAPRCIQRASLFYTNVQQCMAIGWSGQRPFPLCLGQVQSQGGGLTYCSTSHPWFIPDDPLSVIFALITLCVNMTDDLHRCGKIFCTTHPSA
mmetsp:Transcript_62056/g.110557  ORF Transcript_62056/g.110557 Transcript_62056/m.110557 type:complete len:123 (-) Transcript_62056:764-1132(-)